MFSRMFFLIEFDKDCSKSNVSYFIMLTHNVRGGCWWYGSRGWTSLPVFHYILLRMTDGREAQSDKMTSNVEVHMKQRCVIEFLHAEKNVRSFLYILCFQVGYQEKALHQGVVRHWNSLCRKMIMALSLPEFKCLVFLSDPASSHESDSTILMSSFQLGIVYDSMPLWFYELNIILI